MIPGKPPYLAVSGFAQSRGGLGELHRCGALVQGAQHPRRAKPGSSDLARGAVPGLPLPTGRGILLHGGAGCRRLDDRLRAGGLLRDPLASSRASQVEVGGKPRWGA